MAKFISDIALDAGLEYIKAQSSYVGIMADVTDYEDSAHLLSKLTSAVIPLVSTDMVIADVSGGRQLTVTPATTSVPLVNSGLLSTTIVLLSSVSPVVAVYATTIPGGEQVIPTTSDVLTVLPFTVKSSDLT